MARSETHTRANKSTCDGCAPRDGHDGHEDKDHHSSDHRLVLAKCRVGLASMPASLFLASIGLHTELMVLSEISNSRQLRHLLALEAPGDET